MTLAERYILLVKDALVQAVELTDIEPLKAKQEEAILSFLAVNDTFVSLPTEYGKPIIYRILLVLLDLLLYRLVAEKIL